MAPVKTSNKNNSEKPKKVIEIKENDSNLSLIIAPSIALLVAGIALPVGFSLGFAALPAAVSALGLGFLSFLIASVFTVDSVETKDKIKSDEHKPDFVIGVDAPTPKPSQEKPKMKATQKASPETPEPRELNLRNRKVNFNSTESKAKKGTDKKQSTIKPCKPKKSPAVKIASGRLLRSGKSNNNKIDSKEVKASKSILTRRKTSPTLTPAFESSTRHTSRKQQNVKQALPSRTIELRGRKVKFS